MAQKFIRNKICKTFVDYCLLDDVEEVKKYVSIDKFNLLNAFERVLLVATLSQHGVLQNESRKIVEMMEMQ